ncbi:MAG: glycosyltransferase, partial [Candidatus Electrothrix sp. EH2]|nr:glycosyltransferase [Candidatus Electrothrix sp. EH2]
MTSTDLKTLSISVIIPVLNEEQLIGPCLDRLFAHPEHNVLEIIVVDGGSSDATPEEISRRGLRPLSSDPGRGRQQHRGAEAASAAILLFLHCDTVLPNSFFEDICLTLAPKNVAAGAFRLHINGRRAGFRLLEAGVQLRSTVFSLPYGDQALFMHRETYFAAKGFPQQAIMEDVALVSRLKKLGKIALTPSRVTTSARRWQQHGLLKTTLINQLMLIGRAIGISPQQL